MNMPEIRLITETDWEQVWSFIEPVFQAGETYGFPTDLTKEEGHRLWIEIPQETYVCVDDQGDVLGTYYIKPNQMGPGSHVCNCGYIVSDKARGLGIARKMGEHSLSIAKDHGYHAMQYNLVVSTNEIAVKLWQSIGFEIKATLEGAYQHKTKGLVDAYVMYRLL